MWWCEVVETSGGGLSAFLPFPSLFSSTTSEQPPLSHALAAMGTCFRWSTSIEMVTMDQNSETMGQNNLFFWIVFLGSFVWVKESWHIQKPSFLHFNPRSVSLFRNPFRRYSGLQHMFLSLFLSPWRFSLYFKNSWTVVFIYLVVSVLPTIHSEVCDQLESCNQLWSLLSYIQNVGGSSLYHAHILKCLVYLNFCLLGARKKICT